MIAVCTVLLVFFRDNISFAFLSKDVESAVGSDSNGWKSDKRISLGRLWNQSHRLA